MFNRLNKIQFLIIVAIAVFSFFIFNNAQAQGNCPAPLCIDNVQSSTTTNGATITWTTNIPATSEIEYWLNARNPTPKISVRTSPATSHSITIPTGGSLALNPNFTYGFKITVNASGFSPSTFTSQFRTQAPTSSCSDPVCISGVVVGSVTQTSAVITWTTNVPANSQVEYGPTTRYGNITPVSSGLTASHRVTLTGLNPGFTYNFRTISSVSGFLARSSNSQFTTQPDTSCNDPVCIANLQASPTADGAVITWTTNVPATSQVRYNTRPIFTTGETRSTPVDSSQSASHRVTISGLNSGTTYYVQAVSSDGSFPARSSAVQFTVGGTIGGGGTGTCGGAGQPACKPGESKTIGFEIPNPLKGGATDLAGLVKVLAQWLFNLAIPIAVIMIIYAGVLFLTAQGNPTTITKAKDVLKYAVIGLAIILIGSGFVTLIQSILELGSPSPSGPGLPGPEGPPVAPAPGSQPVGGKCSRDRDCFTGLKCQDNICKRAAGNLAGEPCNAGRNCDIGLSCDKSGDAKQEIDGQILGTCFVNSVPGGRIGDLCEKDSNCLSGLKCNKICQRKDGNLDGEACVKTAATSNCKSRACKTVGDAVVGECVPYSGT